MPRKTPSSTRPERTARIKRLSDKLRGLADALEHHFTACAGDDRDLMELAGQLREVAAQTEANPAVEIDDVEELVAGLEERVARHQETCQA